jgi:hypothetical protein
MATYRVLRLIAATLLAFFLVTPFAFAFAKGKGTKTHEARAPR